MRTMRLVYKGGATLDVPLAEGHDVTVQRHLDLAAIVRDLAESDPIAASEVCGEHYCTLCTWDDAQPHSGEVGRPLPGDHDVDCPWRRANEVDL